MFNISYPFPLPEVGHCHHDQARSLFNYQHAARQLIEGPGFYQNWLLSPHLFIHRATVAVVERATIVLRAAAGEPDKEIAQAMGVSPRKVSRSCERFLALGLPGLEKNAPYPPMKPRLRQEQAKTRRAAVVRLRTVEGWTTQQIADVSGISRQRVHQLLEPAKK